MLNQALYKDSRIEIQQVNDKLYCKWDSPQKINHSYMLAKLSEVIGNLFPGSWPVKSFEEAEKHRGMRCFIIEQKGDVIFARWI